eukprot:gene11548-34265_t
MRSKCTTVIVAHRLSTIMDADMILVLGQGNVAEVGSRGQADFPTITPTPTSIPGPWPGERGRDGQPGPSRFAHQNSLSPNPDMKVLGQENVAEVLDQENVAEVLDQGNVAEVGSHDELLEKDGLYASMWFHQKSTHAPSVTSASRAMSTTFDIIEDDEEGEDCEEGEEEGGGQSLAPNRMPRPPKNPMFTSGRLLSVLRSPGPSRFRSFSREGSVSGMMMDGDNTDDDRAATPGKPGDDSADDALRK